MLYGSLVVYQFVIEFNVTYKQHWWSCCGTSDVLSRGHPSSCVSTPCSVHSQDGGSTVVINQFASAVGFQLLLLLLNNIQQDDLSAAWSSLCYCRSPVSTCHTQGRQQSPPWLCWKSSATDLHSGKFHDFQPLSLHSDRSS